MKRGFYLSITVIFLYGATVCMNGYFKDNFIPKNKEADIIQRIFGSLRVFVGDWAFMKAEEYHHRGLPLEEAMDYHKGESLETSAEHHEDENAHSPVEVPANLYGKIYSQVKVTKDSHLKPEEEKEVLPWFYIECAFNPHDIRGYVLGSYWLERVGKKAEAMKFLNEGLRNNPDSAEILSAKGELYYRDGKMDEAKSNLEQAKALWLSGGKTTEMSTRYADTDKYVTFDMLASIYEKEKNYAKALNIYKEILKFNSNPAIVEKVKNLEKETEKSNDNNKTERI